MKSSMDTFFLQLQVQLWKTGHYLGFKTYYQMVSHFFLIVYPIVIFNVTHLIHAELDTVCNSKKTTVKRFLLLVRCLNPHDQVSVFAIVNLSKLNLEEGWDASGRTVETVKQMNRGIVIHPEGDNPMTVSSVMDLY